MAAELPTLHNRRNAHRRYIVHIKKSVLYFNRKNDCKDLILLCAITLHAQHFLYIYILNERRFGSLGIR